MPLSPLEHLRHILDEINYLVTQSKGLKKEDFMRDETLRRAFLRGSLIQLQVVPLAPA